MAGPTSRRPGRAAPALQAALEMAMRTAAVRSTHTAAAATTMPFSATLSTQTTATPPGRQKITAHRDYDDIWAKQRAQAYNQQTPSGVAAGT
jgi:hypothetical protein